jgi:hypothetical protein
MTVRARLCNAGGSGEQAPAFAPLLTPRPSQLSKRARGSFLASINLQSLAAPVSYSYAVGSASLRHKARADHVSFLSFQCLAQQPTSIGFRAVGLNDLQVLAQVADAKQPAAS